MLRLVSVVALMTASLAISGVTTASQAATSSVVLSPITATFVPSQFATHYTVRASDLSKRPLTYAWTLSVQLVDKSGAADPATPGSHAGVDLGCNNHAKLSATTPTFVWQHGDASLGNCNHAKMGPSGHQGKITLVLSDGNWSCTATYLGTNTGLGAAPTCAPVVKVSSLRYKCQGSQVTLLQNSNGGAVLGGGRPPSFLTHAGPYCVTQIITYHWNNGHGSPPGTIGLHESAGIKLGPWKASGSSGQGSATNVNWTVNLSTSTKPVVINGVYSCVDSNSATWSQDPQSHGTGFCQVYGVKAVAVTTTTPKKTTTTTTKSAIAKCKGSKLTLTATPNAGKPPLSVTFAVCSAKTGQWRIDFGDGQSKVANGQPPKSLVHVYKREGDYKARLLTTANGTSAQSATTNVLVHFKQLISLSANPAAGPAPLRVAFGLSTSVVNITTWTLDFGDGTHTGGVGNPPASVAHKYASNGSYKVYFAVKPGHYAADFTAAQIIVGGGTPPILGVSASPTTGSHPLRVTFSIGTTIPGVIVSWVLTFGDGSRQSGQGRPPSNVVHTYTKKGVFLAMLALSQQQHYGGALYYVPRNGLAIQVR